MLTVRRANLEDIPRIQEVYAYARKFMAENGNPTQWAGGHPKEAVLRQDIAAGQLYVVVEGKQIQGVFAFILGEDPTYQKMDGGWWREDSEYGTIHRIASCGKGVFRTATEYAFSCKRQVRIDTHRDNFPMQHLLEKYGFSYRGIIYLENGDPRLAYDGFRV